VAECAPVPAANRRGETPATDAELEIRLDVELQPERVLAARILARGAAADAILSLALEVPPADVKIASAKDASGPLETRVEAAPDGRSVIRWSRKVRGPLEVVVRVRAGAPTPATRPTLGIDDNQARIPGEVIPLPEPLGEAIVDLRLELGQLDHREASGASTLAATNVYRGRVTLGAVRRSYAALVDGEIGTARFHSSDGDDHASWTGYTSFDPRWAFAETAGVRTGVDRYLGVRPGGQHGVVLVSDRRKDLPFAMVPRASGLWISADIDAPWDATPLLRVSQHFAQRLVGAGLWIGQRGGPREPEGWFWSEGVSRVVGRESLYQLGLLSYDDLAADLNAALAEVTLSKLRASRLEALVASANAGSEGAVDARRMLAARGILWATSVDARMRAASKGQKDLRDLMRAIVAEAGKQRRDTWSVEELRAFVSVTAGEAEGVSFSRAIVEGRPADSEVPAGASGTCHELLRRKLSRFELGFEWTPAPKPTDPSAPPATSLGIVTSVMLGSAAERAGVLAGDRIEEMKFTPGRVDVAAKLKLSRAGRTLDVAYAPHGEEREGPMFVRKKGAKDESCTR